MMSLVTFMLILQVLNRLIHSTQSVCELDGGVNLQTEYACYKQAINSSAELNCRGFFSCAASPLILNFQGKIQCEGAYSCYNSQNILQTSTVSGVNVNCGGLYSCANVGNITVEAGDVNCYGELSCSSSELIVSVDHVVNCHGDHSCANSIIHGAKTVTVYGSLGASNATFYSDNTNTQYNFYSSQSGYNATIVCNDSDTCVVYCYDDGCNNLTIIGEFTVHCDYSQNNTICPNGKLNVFDYGSVFLFFCFF